MGFITHKSCIKTVKSGDPDFTLVDGPVLYMRAGFEINQQCPREYKLIIAQCISNGWLKPVAFMRDDELMWDRLIG